MKCIKQALQKQMILFLDLVKKIVEDPEKTKGNEKGKENTAFSYGWYIFFQMRLLHNSL